jgi:SAM-dependent methyltransferase
MGGMNERPHPPSDGIDPVARVLPAHLSATRAEFLAERADEADEDVHFTEAVATTVIESLTAPGGLVLDPFAGFGTTLAVAGRLGRRAVGIELLPERVEACRRRAPDATVIEGDYASYLAALTGIATTVRDLLRPGGHLVLNVANLRHAGHTTTLAWDVARAVGRVLPFVEETMICWDELPHDFTGDYLLTFRHEGER